METLTTKSGSMTFVHASHIARAHGYGSCLFLPDDHLLYTMTNNTLALFAPYEEAGPVQCIAYNDLSTMNEETLLTALQRPLPPTGTDEPKKRRVPNKAQS